MADHTELSYSSSINPKEPVASILTITPITGMLQWCHDHTGTHGHTDTQLVPKTGNVMDFTLFYVLLLAINTKFLCIYREQCCFVSLLSVPCIMMKWFIQIQLNVLCYQVFNFNSCKCRVWDTCPHYLIHN